MWTTSIALPVSNIESQDSAGFVQEDRDYLKQLSRKYKADK